ncbi:phage N-6-adenine-methyltransferase [Aeromonas aquatica]|uniref:phage N-6-adenine-methyltransferase n=1 Tax=Aeromonas aquatica TaxID=558964 RepID=UPI00051B8B92|nr:phage N-6-adenine-methyltransferase [Aeromonas aquatica]
MNHYAQALAELQVQPDHELKQIGDQWQTPKALAWGLFHQFAPTLGPVVLDMFADDCNHLVPHYYDAEDNALTQELAADLRRLGGVAYANPPYSRPCTDSEGKPITGMEAILNYCCEQRALGAKIMLLIKAATSETWWPEDADFIQFISGRIGFEVPSWYVPRDPKKDKPSSSGFASAVVIFDTTWQGERRPEARLRRDDLITTGQIILDMIHRQAVELTLAADQVIRSTTHKLAPAVIQDQPAAAEPVPVITPQGIEPLQDWQHHPAIKSVIYQIDEADLLTPANTRLLAGYIHNLQASGTDGVVILENAIQMARHLLTPDENQLPLSLNDEVTA